MRWILSYFSFILIQISGAGIWVFSILGIISYIRFAKIQELNFFLFLSLICLLSLLLTHILFRKVLKIEAPYEENGIATLLYIFHLWRGKEKISDFLNSIFTFLYVITKYGSLVVIVAGLGVFIKKQDIDVFQNYFLISFFLFIIWIPLEIIRQRNND